MSVEAVQEGRYLAVFESILAQLNRYDSSSPVKGIRIEVTTKSLVVRVGDATDDLGG